MAMNSYGAKVPAAQGAYGKFGARTPGTGAGNPATAPDALAAPPAPPTRRPAPPQGAPPLGGGAGGAAPPNLQTPSVNRDGTIPPPAAPPLPPQQAFTGTAGAARNAPSQASQDQDGRIGQPPPGATVPDPRVGQPPPPVAPPPLPQQAGPPPLPQGAGGGSARDQLTNAYRQYIGRDPEAGAVDNWLSGAYGWGTGEGQVGQMIQGIQNSGEAQAYAAAHPQGGGGGGGSYQQQGTYQPPDLGPLSDPMWADYVKTHLAPKALLQDNLSVYNKSQVGDYQGPVNAQVTQAHNDLLMKALQNPESMSPQVVAAMKEQQKESSLALRQQLMNANAQGNISRGTYGGGYMAGQGQTIGDKVSSDITKGYRDIDTTAATTNFNDRLNTLGVSDQMQSGMTGRAQGDYASMLTGRQFNADENLRGTNSGNDKTKFAYQRTLDEANLQNQAIQNALQAWSTQTQESLGRSGIGLDWAKFGEGSLMGRLGYGLDLARFQQGGQNSLQNYLTPR